MPTYPTISDSYVRNYVGTLMAIDQQLQDQKVAAMRWQGARDYENMVRSGADPRDALRRTAGKLFYNDPRALAATVPSLLSEPGGLITDPETGRRFTVDRFGNYKAIPDVQPGWRRVTDPSGQSYTVRLQPGEQVPTGREPRQPPPIFTAPGGGQYFMMPGGNVRAIQRDPVLSSAAKETLATAQAEALTPLQEWRKAKIAQEGGEVKYGWPDWLIGGQTTEQYMAEREEKLKQLGFDTQGQIIPESNLGRMIFQNAAPAGQASPGASAVAPSPQQFYNYRPPAPAPTAPPAPTQLRRTELPGGGFRLERVRPAGEAQRPQPSVNRPLKADEVLKYTRDGRAILVNTRTGERMWYGQ